MFVMCNSIPMTLITNFQNFKIHCILLILIICGWFHIHREITLQSFNMKIALNSSVDLPCVLYNFYLFYILLFVTAQDVESKDIHVNILSQSRIIGAVRGTHSQLWETIIPVCSPYAPRNMTRDLAYLQVSDLEEEIKPICRTSELQGERILIGRT